MGIRFSRTIVHCRDKDASARFLAEILGLPDPIHLGHFGAVALEHDASLDFIDAAELEFQTQRYAFLVGDWETRILAYEEDGTRHQSRGEIHAGWVLAGRAIQDVWMTPPRAERRPGQPLPRLPVTGAWYGTTLRIYDPKLEAGHVLWGDPATQFYAQQVGFARRAAPK